MVQKSFVSRFLPLIAYMGVIVSVFGRAILPPHDTLIFGDDLHLTYYFFRKYYTESLSQGFFPWWNPYLFSGTPFAAHPQTLLPFYPLNWLFVAAPLNIAFSWYLAIHVLVAMIGMYWLCRIFTGKIAAWTGGVSFGLSGFFMARIWAGHVDMVAAAAYLPIVFGFFWIAMREGRPRSIVLAGVALTIQLLVGYQTVAIFTLEAIGIAALFLSLEKRSFKPLARMLAAVILGLGLAAVQLIPQQEFIARSIRTFQFPYEWASAQALTIEGLKVIISPLIFGDQRTYHGPWPNLAEYASYIGLVSLSFAFVSLFGIFGIPKRKFLIITFASIGMFALWISFANNAPIDLLKILWTSVPVYRSIRIPVRHLLLFVFASSFLAGIAIDVVKRKSLLVCLVVLTLADLIPFARHFIELRAVPEERHDPKLVKLFESDKTLFRILPNFGVWLEPRSSFDFDSAMTYKLFSTTGYDPSILRNYYEFIDAAGGHPNSSFLEHNVQVPYLDVNSSYINFLNIKYIFVPTWPDPFSGGGDKRFSLLLDDPTRGYRLYENTQVLPRFFLVSQIQSFQNREDIIKAIATDKIDLSQTLLEVGSPVANRSACPQKQDNVTVRSYSPNRIDLTVDAPCDTNLVTSEVNYPGWVATVDGKKTNIDEGNLAFRTIKIPRGNHAVALWYTPQIFLVGGSVSIIFVFISILFLRTKQHIL